MLWLPDGDTRRVHGRRRQPLRQTPVVRWSLADSTPAKDHRFCEWTSKRAEERIASRSDTDRSSPVGPESHYEPLDVPPLVPFWLGFLLAVFVAGVLVSITIAFPLARHQEYRGPMKELPAAPRLQSAPTRDLQRYEAAKRQELRGSGNTVPITVAMRETARQGWGPPK
jgi:hypothetical protein